jgi:hypothetical protein
MKTATKLLILTFVLVGVYLLARNSVVYKSALAFISASFAKAYGALVKGETE